ncbi:MAG TPA: response regulator [Syntrophobacteria bacterium]|nr:response regulator [Syntrophobacteria bacterium]
MRVLIVDDEEDFRKTLATRLHFRDLPSETAENGEEALRFVREQAEPDVMVLDLRLPGMDGLEILRQTKLAYPDMEVIILTGYGTGAAEAEARQLGAFDYLQKPVPVDLLAEKIKSAYRRKLERTTAPQPCAECD